MPDKIQLPPDDPDHERIRADSDEAMEAHEDEMARRHAGYMERELMKLEPRE